jgi:DnaK suppressor protein
VMAEGGHCQEVRPWGSLGFSLTRATEGRHDQIHPGACTGDCSLRRAVLVNAMTEVASSDLNGDGWAGSSYEPMRDRDQDDMLALAWDLRVRELEREFALSAAPRAGTPSRCEPGRRRERALACARIAATRWATQEIDAALARIKNGHYGMCERCSHPIPAELLATAPLGRLCIQCRTPN